ncbi:hypothetical protein [Streptomyces qinglanensis]|uniref:hypothetical protein n=1 Tax=Streptomyces qinglanensis TaxID=943816 RepID=UPI0037B530EE
MQHRAAIFQANVSATRSAESLSTRAGGMDVRPGPAARTDTPALHFEKLPRRDQDILRTSSRRVGPRAWLDAVTWLVDARLHPKHLHPNARSSAVGVARDLARRMDYRRGIVLYDLKGTAARLKMSESNVKRHVSYFRELGVLVWVQHGSKRNLRLPDRRYTATATIYAATIPPVYDTAKGHRLRGEGYEATVIGVTEAGRELAVDRAVEKAAHKSGRRRLAPPSRGTGTYAPVLETRGRNTPTREARTQRRSPPRKSILGRRVTTSLYQTADRLARRLRPRHDWTRRARISDLSWVLIDKIAEGNGEQQLDQWLREISPALRVAYDWRPQRPHLYIAGQLRREFEHRQWEAERQAVEDEATAPNDAFRDAVAQARAKHTHTESPIVGGLSGVDDEMRAFLRLEAWAAYKQDGDPSLVIAAHEFLGPTAAAALFSAELVSRCLALASNSKSSRMALGTGS